MNEKIRCESKMGGWVAEWLGVKAVQKILQKSLVLDGWMGGSVDGWK